MAKPVRDLPLASALTDPQQPGDLLLYRLHKLAAASGRLITRLLERRYGITRREWGALMWLARQPGMQPSQLADALELDRARISRAIASMQAKGLLQKSTVPLQPRLTTLRITPAGQELHDELLPQIRALNLRLVSVLDRQSIVQLDISLQHLEQQMAALASDTQEAAPFPARHRGHRVRHTP